MDLNKDTHKYDDIINLPHHVSAKHPQMSLLNRAAQFSPFAALTGHGEAIRETARLTDDFVELSDEQKKLLDEKLRLIMENLSQKPEIEATYFQPDKQKSGGSYTTIHGKVKAIDVYDRKILFMDGTSFPMEHLFAIEGDLFKNTDSF